MLKGINIRNVWIGEACLQYIHLPLLPHGTAPDYAPFNLLVHLGKPLGWLISDIFTQNRNCHI